MKRYIMAVAIAAGALLTFTLGFCARKERMENKLQYPFIQSVADVQQLFPKTVDEINAWVADYKDEVTDAINALIAIPSDQRTFENTARPLDTITCLSRLSILGNGISVAEYVHPDKAMRDAAHEASMQLSAFWIDTISTSKDLYNAFAAYVDGAYKDEQLTAAQRYFVDETMDDFKRAGLHLPDAQLERVKALKKELMVLGQEFSKNIADDSGAKHITVTRDGLRGLEDDFIAQLKKDGDDQFVLGVDYPTLNNVMDNCTVEATRRDLYRAFNNRAFPQNEELLKQIIAKRDALAKELGFGSYAELDLSNQMVKEVARADEFLAGLLDRVQPKVAKELAMLTETLPESVTLTADGKIKPWDLGFIKSEYKKNKYAIDERKIAEYFPMKQTVDQLLDIYHQFLGVDFEVVNGHDFWHEDVQLVAVKNKQGNQVGYLLLDLYPRPGKYSHAAHVTIYPALDKDGDRKIAVSLVMANFPKPTSDKPALLKRGDVNTFFHEFGHAMHAMLGATSLASFSGTSVKRDFVEMPSQMLEEWLQDKDMLKKVSHHYQTGESLPDDIIDTLIELKNLTTGLFVQRQGFLANLALAYFKEGAIKDPYAIEKKLYETLTQGVAFDSEYRMYTAFGHLTGYAAKYYGYLWSKVFALDLFDTIKQHGLLDGAIGQRYVNAVLAKGGSQDPNELLVAFLGREPNDTAFLKDLGLS